MDHDVPQGEYDYQVADAIAEYDFKLSDKYTITPGLSYQTATFDDRDYVNPSEGVIGYFNDVHTINTTSAHVRTDLNFTKKLRVLGGLRVDKFSVPDDAYLAYELAATYKINENNLIRAAITRSNSGSFLGYNYINIAGRTGNTDLDIFTLNMVELGYRVQISNKLLFDVDVFSQSAENLSALLQASEGQQFFNIPTTARQIGATISLNFVPNDKLQFKPFVTIQKTETEDMPSIYLDPALGDLIGMPVTYSDSEHLYTPRSYGGFYFNYRALSKLNINLSSYYFTDQTNYDATYDVNDPSTPQYAAGQIEGKFMVNAKVSYEVLKGLNAFVSGRNILGASSREFYGGEETKGMFLGGISYKMN
jgi:iron complex outermembrane receptor protein